MSAGRVMSSEYMEWAKTRSKARFNLATSGVNNYALAELPVRLEDLEISGPTLYGYAPLIEAIAAKHTVSPKSVVTATGTSGANHLAMAALIQPGDEILIENPTYELLVSTALYLGARVQRFERSFENGFSLDPEQIERRISNSTRLIIITNLHNPSGALTAESTLRRIGEIARGAGARVLVDEVYLDGAFGLAPRSSFHLGEHFIITSSLTKVYGLSGLRCGWILASPELADRMWRLNDLFGVIPSHLGERVSVVALANLGKIADKTRSLLAANTPLLDKMFEKSSHVLSTIHGRLGTVAFPRLDRGRVEDLCSLLREKYETAVVPGRFFGKPDHFRIGIGGETEMVSEGLSRLSAAIQEMK
jgi:aspartate/methionine/tyrosine aminotransferase